MKVLVTGANGFLSGHIINELLKCGYSVRAMMRAGAKAPALTGLDVEVIYGNITDKSAIEKAVTGCEIVIHAAADTNQSYRKIEDYYPANVEATANIIEAMSDSGCKRLIFVSSANTMGFGTLENPGNEETPASSLLLKSGYAKSKFVAQNLVLEAVKNHKIDAVVVNPTFMIGPFDYHPKSGRIFKMILGKKIAFYPPGGKNFVDVRDAAKGIVNAINLGKSGECYLIAGENLSFRDFFQKTKLHAKQKTKIIPIPVFIIKLAGICGSIFRHFGLNIELSFVNASILCANNFFDNRKAVNELRLPFAGIEKTIGDYLKWVNAENS